MTVSYLFVSMLAVFAATDKVGLFCPLMLSVLAHEFAHVGVLYLYGCKIRAVKLTLGSVGVEFRSSPEKYEEIVSLLSGPLINLILSFFCYLLDLTTMFGVNLVLGIVNLLPVSGLDGGSIIEKALEGLLTTARISFITFVISSVTVLLLIWCGYNYLDQNISVMIFGLYLFSSIIIKNLLKENRN